MLCGAMFKLATLMHQGQGRRPDRERGVWFKQYFIQENIIINNTKTLHRNTSRADNAIMCLRPLLWKGSHVPVLHATGTGQCQLGLGQRPRAADEFGWYWFVFASFISGFAVISRDVTCQHLSWCHEAYSSSSARKFKDRSKQRKSTSMQDKCAWRISTIQQVLPVGYYI